MVEIENNLSGESLPVVPPPVPDRAPADAPLLGPDPREVIIATTPVALQAMRGELTGACALFALTVVSAVAFQGCVGGYLYQESAYLLQPGRAGWRRPGRGRDHPVPGH